VVTSALIGTPLDATCIPISGERYIWLGSGGHRVWRNWAMRIGGDGILQHSTRPGTDCKSLGSRTWEAAPSMGLQLAEFIQISWIPRGVAYRCRRLLGDLGVNCNVQIRINCCTGRNGKWSIKAAIQPP